MVNFGISRRVFPWISLCVVTTGLLFKQMSELEALREKLLYSFPAKFQFQTPYFGLIYSGESRNFIDDRILQFGAFEKPELFLLRKIAGERKGLVFLDVGANTGAYSLFMSQVAEKVHAVEPFPPVLAKLRRNIELNQLTNVMVHPVGFGKERGSLTFYAPPDSNLGVGSFSNDFAEEWRGGQARALVDELLPLEIGDEYLQRHGITRVDILKIDIEGYEKFALQGLSQTLRSNRPYVLMEFNTRNVEGFHSLTELENIFPPQYIFYSVISGLSDLRNGSYRLELLSRIPGGQANVLAVPREHGIAL